MNGKVLLTDSSMGVSPERKLNELIASWNKLELKPVELDADRKPYPNQKLFSEMKRIKEEIDAFLTVYPNLGPVLLKEYNFKP